MLKVLKNTYIDFRKDDKVSATDMRYFSRSKFSGV